MGRGYPPQFSNASARTSRHTDRQCILGLEAGGGIQFSRDCSLWTWFPVAITGHVTDPHPQQAICARLLGVDLVAAQRDAWQCRLITLGDSGARRLGFSDRLY
jgi:hypothetical protein